MNKVIIVGHPSSGLAAVEERLRLSGMKAPLPSRREGLLPEEIAVSLCRAHLADFNAIPTRESDIHQIQAGPVWHDMVLDLLLGNVQQELWGWADTRFIHLLEFWHELDPLAAFVLVYDEPQRALAEAALHGGEDLDETHLRCHLDHWAAYNGAMLQFYLRHPERCILANTRQALQESEQLIQHLRTRISPPLQTAAIDHGASAESPQARILNEMLNLSVPDPAKALQILRAGETEHFLLDCHVSGDPIYLKQYEELQASADLPFHPVKSLANQSGLAWNAFVAQRHLTAEILTQLHRERYLLLSQLHQIQEELELLYLNGRRLDKRAHKSHKTSNPNALLGAADRIKQQLSYRLGHVLVKRSRSVIGCLAMPFSLAGEVCRFRSDQKHIKPKHLPPIHTYDDAEEAERVKNQLSYRLGNVLVRHAGNPMRWVKLPFAMRGEIKAFQAQRKAKPSTPQSKSTKP